MYDKNGNRLTSQTWRGDDFTQVENPDIITEVPTQDELQEMKK